MKIIGLDLDSVLSYTEDVIHKYVKDNFGIAMDWDDVDRYELEYFPGLTVEMGVQLKEEIESGVVLMDVLPHKYAQYSTELLKFADMTVYIVTSRPNHLKEPTIEWLKKYKIIYDEIFFTRSMKKSDVVKEYSIQAFVEDRADILEAIKRECGVLPLGLYLVNQPWNRKCEDDSIYRVDNIMVAVHEIIRRDGYER